MTGATLKEKRAFPPQPTGLKPVNVLQAARADLRLLEQKRQKKVDPELRYSFAAQHVKRARSPEHLISMAFHEGTATNKWSTLILYGDRELLRVTVIETMGGVDAREVARLVEAARAEGPAPAPCLGATLEDTDADTDGGEAAHDG
jgi:hypothetical protein